ncbi:AMP-binding protein [Georgenia sp. Z1344]|uniref:AMP-binding protein n=1 Tax=Georgenia sp. Z1344 TaxID=3416706 RepID=UPI003CFB61D5
MERVEVLPGGTRPGDVAALHEALALRLGGADLPPLLPVAPGTDPDQARDDLADSLERPVPDGTAALLRTSGSTTGTGHVVALSADALTASARATHARLGGPGRWVLAVPAHHVAGLQILTRSAVAGHDPLVLDTTGGFDPAALAEVVRMADGTGEPAPAYLSLVPTQLVRALAAGPDVTGALAGLGAVLVGGAALAPSTLRAAADAGIRVVRTYGMTETGGGCVYDGRPLDGVGIEVDDESRIWLSGPVLAHGYLDDAAADASTFVGGRLRTTDAGRITDTGALEVLGRLDDAVTSGGVTVAPVAVERRLTGMADVAECAVVGVPDPEWGEIVVAVVVLTPGRPPGPTSVPELLAVARAQTGDLSPAHAPRALVVVDRLPLRGPGKVDRRAVTTVASRALGVGTGDHSGDRRTARAGDGDRVTVAGVARYKSRPALG